MVDGLKRGPGLTPDDALHGDWFSGSAESPKFGSYERQLVLNGILRLPTKIELA